ncbi:hypothetical protein AV530_001990 [Patagioenas fasciata monilis]|uniref:Uncharacterized protein n=1 Tax=Patagioenas fasciata monilis TaxID=372326 RepID=A0A1V4J6U5_PATFA|nr:hypothetical protein AV530_001990 [Patagioenas fasciata monilis]
MRLHISRVCQHLSSILIKVQGLRFSEKYFPSLQTSPRLASASPAPNMFQRLLQQKGQEMHVSFIPFLTFA